VVSSHNARKRGATAAACRLRGGLQLSNLVALDRMASGFRGTFLLAGLLAFAAIGGTQFAQSTPTIPVAGRVTDAAFNQIANVTVTLKALGSDKGIAKVETDQTGAFKFPAVPFGAHELYFEKTGFMTVTFPIQVSPAEKYVDVGSVILQVGKVAEG
jgi:hypothetical protein